MKKTGKKGFLILVFLLMIFCTGNSLSKEAYRGLPLDELTAPYVVYEDQLIRQTVTFAESFNIPYFTSFPISHYCPNGGSFKIGSSPWIGIAKCNSGSTKTFDCTKIISPGWITDSECSYGEIDQSGERFYCKSAPLGTSCFVNGISGKCGGPSFCCARVGDINDFTSSGYVIWGSENKYYTQKDDCVPNNPLSPHLARKWYCQLFGGTPASDSTDILYCDECSEGVCIGGSSPPPDNGSSPAVCSAGTVLVYDLLNSINGGNNSRCCKPGQCLVGNICVDSGYADTNNWMSCSNGVWTAINSKCFDSDGGKNYEKPGIAYPKDSSVDSRYDCCKAEYSNNTGDAVNHISAGGGDCQSNGKYLYEAICKNEIPDYTVIECLNGCQNGKCFINESGDEPSPPDEPDIPTEPDLDVPCVDSDRNSGHADGRNLYEYGIVQYLNEYTDYSTKHDEDMCLDWDDPEYQPVSSGSDSYYNIRETVCTSGPDGLYPNREYYVCPLGCENGACIGNPSGDYSDVDTDTLLSATGCCMNPLSSPCSFTEGSDCCSGNGNYLSEQEKQYTSTPGPGDQTDCIRNYFHPWGDETACWRMSDANVELCTQGCCCQLSENSDLSVSAVAIIDYKINCWGSNKFWTDIQVLEGSGGESCTNEVCADKLARGDYEIVNENDINPFTAASLGNTDPTATVDNPYDAKKDGEECTAGNCQTGSFCLEDYDIAGKMICCPEKKCAVQGTCMDEAFIIIRDQKNIVCVNSKWIPETATLVPNPEPEKKGCSFVPGMKNTPDFGLILIPLLFSAVFFAGRIRRKDDLASV